MVAEPNREPRDPQSSRDIQVWVPVWRTSCRRTLGSDTGTGVDDRDYQVPFAFTRKIEKLNIKIDRPQLSTADIKRLQAEGQRNNHSSELPAIPYAPAPLWYQRRGTVAVCRMTSQRRMRGAMNAVAVDLASKREAHKISGVVDKSANGG